MPKRVSYANRVKIQVLHQRHWKVTDIAREVKVNRKTVRRWIQKEFGDVNEQKHGRPLNASARVQRLIVRQIKEPGASLRLVARKNSSNKDSVKRIVRNASKNDPIKPYKPPLQPRIQKNQMLLRFIMHCKCVIAF